MHKIIKGSNRGLTFSFPDDKSGPLNIGAHYDYIIGDKSVTIKASETGRYTVSRKKSGAGWHALVDLRNKEILDAIAGIAHMRVSITTDEIIVSDADLAMEEQGSKLLVFPRAVLSQLRMAAGISAGSAVDALFAGAQISIDEFLSSAQNPVDIPTLHKDLADVYTVVSLFSGAGILDWPFFQDERFSIKYAIDYEASACETYRRNIGMHVIHGDIHKAFTPEGYPLDETIHDPDVVIGGPSCKPFSNANRHTRLTDHKDSDLVVQYMRIVETLRPKVFVMENVPEVLTACGGAYFEAVKQTAAENGYSVEAKIVQDNQVGGYTTRRRAVIAGSRIGKPVFPAISLVAGGNTAGDALGKVDAYWTNYADVTVPGPETKKRMSFVPQGGNYESIPLEYRTQSQNRHSCTYRRLAWDKPSPTLVNWRKPPLIHPTEDRTLTVAEAKALQGLPGDYRICGTLGQMQQQVGNAVPVAIGRYIKRVILGIFAQASKPIAATI